MTAYSELLSVLGIPVRFESNDARVVEMARAALDSGLHPPPDGRALRVTVLVDHALRESQVPQPRFVVTHDRLFEPRAGESVGRSDPSFGEAHAVISPALLERRELLRYSFIEAMTLWLVTHRDRCPLHAAALIDGDHALLLCGASGSGKSTLAYAAHREGLRVLSEDTVYVQSEPAVRVWGLPGHLHLLPDAERFFPELRGMPTAALPTGKTKIAVPLSRPGGVLADPCARHIGVCLLERGAAPRLERVQEDEVVQAIAGNTAGGFGYHAGTLRSAVESLGTGGGWRLVVPPDPTAAVPLLRTLMEAMRQARHPAPVQGQAPLLPDCPAPGPALAKPYPPDLPDGR